MKSVNRFNDSAISKNTLNKIKGGNTSTTVVIEKMVEVTATVNGSTEMLFCDRRRKKVNC